MLVFQRQQNPVNDEEKVINDFTFRAQLSTEALNDLRKTHPQEAEFLLSIIEQGIKALKQ